MANALRRDEGLDRLALYVSNIVAKESGNVLGPEQQAMVMSRLKKRLIDLGGIDAVQYQGHLTRNYASESKLLVSMLTTHHTFFFREFGHFEFLLTKLDQIVERARKKPDRTIRIASLACSRGQEVYSLVMFFQKHVLDRNPDLNLKIIGTDIDPESVAYGKNGVYPYKEVKTIPQFYLSGLWQRGTGDISHFAKIKEQYKAFVEFRVGNLFDLGSLGHQDFDVVFCRNVFIYFKEPDVVRVCHSIQKILHPEGYFITGLSESLKHADVKVRALAPSVYTFVSEDEKAIDPKDLGEPSPSTSSRPSEQHRGPIRILAVDDSDVILKLLKRVFDSDPGFKLVGTARNGIEAQNFLKNHDVDALTLDIHMPEMNGIEYLQANYGPSHPKVIVISSANREDQTYAQKALRFGACDFIEKPALSNLQTRAEEIKTKIKMALQAPPSIPTLDTEFVKTYKIGQPQSKARLVVMSFSQLKKASAIIKGLEGDQPPFFLVFEGNENHLEVFRDQIAQMTKLSVEVLGEANPFETNRIYLADSNKDLPRILQFFENNPVSVGIIGQCSLKLGESLLSFRKLQLLIEDNAEVNPELKEVASDIFPVTSFEHVATRYLAEND